MIKNKEKFGKNFYYATIVFCIVAFIFALFFVTVNEDKSNATQVTIIRYTIAFYAFATILPIGILVNEVCKPEKDKIDFKKVKIKVIITVALTIIGSTLIFIFKNTNLCFMMLLVAIICLLYILTPSVKK